VPRCREANTPLTETEGGIVRGTQDAVEDRSVEDLHHQTRRRILRLLETRNPQLVPRRVVVPSPDAEITEVLRAVLSVVVHRGATGHSSPKKMGTRPVSAARAEDTKHAVAAVEDSEDIILDTIDLDAIRRRMRAE
jgi:hypothetical protein